MSSAGEDSREPSLLDAACEAFAGDLAELSPTDATQWGIPGYDGELQDFSPEYWEALSERTREMIMDVDAFDEATDSSDDDEDFDDVDNVTAATLRDRLGVFLDKHHHAEDLRLLNVIESPVQIIRDSFLVMGHETREEREAVRSRLAQVPAALEGYRSSLSDAASHGLVAPLRQVDAVNSQCEDLADDGSILEQLGLDADSAEVTAAKEAFGQFADWLNEQLAPAAPHEDAVGRERFELFAHEHIGDEVDLDEAYRWSLERLRELRSQQEKVAEQLYGPGTSVRQAMHKLNQDEHYTIHGTGALVDWMQGVADQAIIHLDGSEFDVPDEIKTIECGIDPAGTGAIFYTPPSDDFARPGRMWWSVPEGQETFHMWQELSTVFHEGVPGHHLQLGVALAESSLNFWRRSVNWIAGHGEGWALYAEELMHELDMYEDPGFCMGLLDAQRLRAARVALDIGVHLCKKTPDGGVWDASYAKTFLRENTAMAEANLAFELDRLLGWPGQGSAYAIGEQLWRSLREDALAQGMSLGQFHNEALRRGSIPMSILREDLLD
ncbi:hypothetical protein CATYP_00320 [Corynebacterium atypicum]|uniref:DUF885 domain-containing protein n=1 Tax=Corynebacterium atypicum TaxID=191610 RepID=A0ABN4DBD0_9CORY|nr:hypothetical protein CATYP_00320 [Corynebacterium atypicum]